MEGCQTVVYLLDRIENIQESDLADLSYFLSDERKTVINRFRFSKDRIQSMLVYLLFRYGLIKDYQLTEIPNVEKSREGKPFMPDYPHICFNFTHCNRAVACGFSDGPVGVDVQHISCYKSSVAKYFMTPEEHTGALVGDKDRNFTLLWTQKESYGKYLGTGICYDMSSLPISEIAFAGSPIIDSFEMDGYFLSVCSEKHLEVRRIAFSELKEELLNFLDT